jgi:hypothetical protein
MLESNHPDPEIRARSNALLAEARRKKPSAIEPYFRAGSLQNVLLTWGVLILLGAAFWFFRDPISKEDLAQMDACQMMLLLGNYGVTYNPETKGYQYSKNKFEELRRLQFLSECMPKSDPYRRDRAREIEKTKREIDEARQEIERVGKKLGL